MLESCPQIGIIYSRVTKHSKIQGRKMISTHGVRVDGLPVIHNVRASTLNAGMSEIAEAGKVEVSSTHFTQV